MRKKEKKKNKKNNAWIYIVVVLVFALVYVLAYSLAGGSPSPLKNVDYSKYSYTDEEVEPQNYSVVLTEYSDFQCPFCGGAYYVLKNLEREYGGKLKVEFKHFPLTRIHPYAMEAAILAECAREQGRFHAFHDVTFETQDRINKNTLWANAAGLGLDMEKMKACSKREDIKDKVLTDRAEGISKKVTGTPSFFIGDKKLETKPMNQMEEYLKGEINKAMKGK